MERKEMVPSKSWMKMKGACVVADTRTQEATRGGMVDKVKKP
jgi:hypothetical protein